MYSRQDLMAPAGVDESPAKRMVRAARLARAIAGGAFAAGTVLLVGWKAYVEWGSSVFPDLAVMKTNAALAIALAGAALWLQTGERRIGRLAFGTLLGLFVAAIGLATLYQDLFAIDLGIDQLIFIEERSGTALANRMAPNTAAALAYLGLSLALIGNRRLVAGAQLLAVVALVTGIQALIGYAFGVRAFYGTYRSMALSTAVLVSSLAAGVLLAVPEGGFLQRFLRDTSAGLVGRRLLPTAIALPILIGLTQTWGRRSGFLDADFAAALTVMATMVVFTALVWLTVRALDRFEADARAADRERIRLLVLEQQARVAAQDAEQRFRGLVHGLDAIVWEADPATLRFTFVSEWAEPLLGYPASRWVEEPSFWIDTLVHPKDRADVHASWSKLPFESPERMLEYRMVAADGRVVWIRETARVVPPSAGRPAYVRGLMVDITEMRQTEFRVAAQHAVVRALGESPTLQDAAPRILRAIGDSLDWTVGGLWIVQRDWNALLCVEIWNSDTVAIPEFRSTSLQRSFAPGVGLPGRVWKSGQPTWIRDVVTDGNFPRAEVAEREGLHGAVGFPIRVGADTIGVIEFFSGEIRAPDDQMLEMMATIGVQIGQFIERKRAEEGTRESEERLRFALEAGRTWTWDMDLRTGDVRWSENVSRIFGFSDDARNQTYETFMRAIHLEDRGSVEEAFRYAIRKRRLYDIEYRMLAPNGKIHWVSVRGRAIRDDNGRPTRMAGIATDVTERKEIEERLREETEAVDIVNELGRTLAAELDLGRLVQTVTDAATRVTGAKYGAFFFNDPKAVPDPVPFAVCGVPRDMSAGFPMPRTPKLFERTFRGEGVIRLDDLAEDPELRVDEGRADHPPAKSCLAVPVVTRSGEVVGGLFFGHPEPTMFGQREERIAVGLAAQAAIAMDNARLYDAERRARADAEAASRAKDEFLAMLGHELRNPIGAISNSIHVLTAKNSAEPAAELHGMIARQTHLLARLVDDLLDVSRVTSGKITLRRQAVDLSAVIARTLESLRASGRGTGRDVVTETETVWVDADPARLEQICGNLLENAFKYTSGGGRIEIVLRPDGDEAVLSITDDGQGIAPELLPRIFDLFAQGRQNADRAEGGLGLGLTMVRRLVEMHGGRAAATSDGIGSGSVFTIRLPRRDAPADTGAVRTVPQFTRRRILVVEDYADSRESLRALLETWGHSVEVAADGVEGVEKVLATRPDVALVDIGLPGVDGYEAARRIRATPGGLDIVLVALTGYGQPYDRLQAVAAGFDEHLVKPLDLERLARFLEQAVRAEMSA